MRSPVAGRSHQGTGLCWCRRIHAGMYNDTIAVRRDCNCSLLVHYLLMSLLCMYGCSYMYTLRWLQVACVAALVLGLLLVCGCLSIADIGTLSKSKSGHKGLSKHSQSIMDLCSRSSIAPLPSASRPGLLAITTIVPISARWIDVNDGS